MMKQISSSNFIKYFRDTLSTVWKVEDKTAGYVKSAGKLELRTINNAGHLVPMDQGKAAREMMKSFVSKATA